jgi:hypothetical protein
LELSLVKVDSGEKETEEVEQEKKETEAVE